MLIEIQKAVRKKIDGATGDILYAHEYIESVIAKKDFELKNVIPLPSNLGTQYGWDLLNYYIDSKSIEELVKESTYECPFNDGNSFFWNVPIGILYTSQKNFNWYKSTLTASDPFQGKFLFSDYMLDHLTISRLTELNGVTKSFLGHGYTDETLPCDGDGNITFTYMPLSNGDKLICASWEWFNK